MSEGPHPMGDRSAALVASRVASPRVSITLHRPLGQSSMVVDDRHLVIGRMAGASGGPLGREAPTTAAATVDAVSRGDASVEGGWVIVSEDADDLVVRTDPYGTRPLFWRQIGRDFHVTQDVWPLAHGCSFDPVGVADFLLIGHHLGAHTMFNGVMATRANSRLRLGDTVTEQSYPWPTPYAGQPTLRGSVAAMSEALDQVYEPYADQNQLLMPLSGGLDSRVLLALARERDLDVHAWTFVMRPGTVEEAIARDVARAVGVEHTVSLLETRQMTVNAAAMVRATSAQLSLEHTHVYGTQQSVPSGYELSVNGIWGDAVCGGSYLLRPRVPDASVTAERARGLLRGRAIGEVQRYLPGVPHWSGRLRHLLDEWYSASGRSRRTSDLLLLGNRATRFNVWGSIAGRDKFDYVAPFLHMHLIRTCYGMPERFHRQSTAYRGVVAGRWPALAAIPWAKTGLPVTKYPSRVRSSLAHRVPALANRTRSGPVAFTDASIYQSAYRDLIREAEVVMTAELEALGIDVAAMLADAPADSPTGRNLRLRLATCLVARREAEDGDHALRSPPR